MTTLLNINSVKIIKYLFLERKDILIRMAYHSYRKSIAETLCKIIKYENKLRDDNETYDEKQFSLIRLEIMNEIFDKIDINMDSEKLFSISFIINDLTEDKKILESMISNKNIINSFINKQLKDIDLISANDEMKLENMKNNFIIISDIIINWLNNIKNNDIQIPMLLYEVNDEDDEDGNQHEDIVQQKEVNNAPPEVHHTILSKALFDVLPNLIQKNFNKRNNEGNKEKKENNYIIQSYNDVKLIPLGLYRIKIVEILTNLIPYFKNISNDYDNLLINSNFFENSINYIFEYEWNNLYQEAIYQFFKQLFKYDKDYPYHEISSEYLFTKLDLLNIIITNFTKNKNESNNDNNSKHGYVPLLVSLSYKINSLIGGNYIKLNKNNAREGSFSFINEGRDLFGNNALDIFFNMSLTNNNNNENKKEEIEPVNCLKKYCNEEWNKFFSDNITNLVTLYEEKLCQQKVSVNVSFGENDDLFAKDDNNNENEALLGANNENKNEENNNDDLVNTNDDIHNKNKEMAKYKDMEINLNDFNFTNDNDNEDKTDEKNKKEDVDIKEGKVEIEKKEEEKREVIEENKDEQIQKEEEKKEEEIKKEEEKKEEEIKKEEVKKEEVKKEEVKKEEEKKEEIKKEEEKKEEIKKEEEKKEEIKKEEVKKEEVKNEDGNKEVKKIEGHKEEVEKIEEKKEEKKEETNIESNKEGNNEENIKNENKNNEIVNESEKKIEIKDDKKENEDKREIKKEVENTNNNVN